MWILWGESLTRFRANFSVVHIGTTFGATVLVVMIVSLFIPAVYPPLFVVLLVAFSGVFLYAHEKVPATYPVLLPHDTVKPAYSSVLAVCSVGCFTGGLPAIISWPCVPVGMVLDRRIHLRDRRGDRCSVDLACLGAFGALQSESFDVQALSVLLGLGRCGARSLFQSHESLYPVAFVVGLSVSSLLEISLIMYFGTLMRRGFFAPALAVTFSLASIRIGIALGNCLGLSLRTSR